MSFRFRRNVSALLAGILLALWAHEQGFGQGTIQTAQEFRSSGGMIRWYNPIGRGRVDAFLSGTPPVLTFVGVDGATVSIPPPSALIVDTVTLDVANQDIQLSRNPTGPGWIIQSGSTASAHEAVDIQDSGGASFLKILKGANVANTGARFEVNGVQHLQLISGTEGGGPAVLTPHLLTTTQRIISSSHASGVVLSSTAPDTDVTFAHTNANREIAGFGGAAGGPARLSFDPTAADFAGRVDLHADATDVLAQRRGTGANPQTFYLYGSFTDASNYERLRIGTVGGRNEIFAESAGTGIDRGLALDAGASTFFFRAGGAAWEMPSGGPLRPFGDNIRDLGDSSNHVRSLYLGTSLIPRSSGVVDLGTFTNNLDDIIARDLFLDSNLASIQMGALQDIQMFRDAADIIALRRGSNEQNWRIYNVDSGANDEFLSVGWNASNQAEVLTTQTGTGVGRDAIFGTAGPAGDVFLQAAGTNRVFVDDSTGHFAPVLTDAVILGLDANEFQAAKITRFVRLTAQTGTVGDPPGNKVDHRMREDIDLGAGSAATADCGLVAQDSTGTLTTVHVYVVDGGCP